MVILIKASVSKFTTSNYFLRNEKNTDENSLKLVLYYTTYILAIILL